MKNTTQYIIMDKISCGLGLGVKLCFSEGEDSEECYSYDSIISEINEFDIWCFFAPQFGQIQVYGKPVFEQWVIVKKDIMDRYFDILCEL